MYLPVLLNIMHFVFLVLIDIPLSSTYDESAESIFLSPSSECDRRMMSSAHSRQLRFCDSSIFKGLQFSVPKRSTMSAMKILNKSGLKMHPCLTPWFARNVSVNLFPTLTQQLSLVYSVLMLLKNFPFIP